MVRESGHVVSVVTANDPSATPASSSTEDEWSKALVLAAEHIERAERLLITSHRGPDGDAVGSMIALASLLRKRGKVALLYAQDQIPRRYKWLPLTSGFRQKLGREATYDATIVVDCAEARLLGPRFPGREITGQVIVLDHHSSGVPYGDVFVCDIDAASAGVLVARLARMLGWSLTREAALGIYFSLASDTGAFRYANTTSEAMRLAAELIDLGVDPGTVNEHLFESFSLARFRVLGALFERIEFAHSGRIALFTLTRELLCQHGASWEDTNDLVNYARSLQGVECGVLLSTARNGDIRVSMRSKGHIVDAGVVCARLGGGGHRGAAGCVLAESMAAARERVLAELAEVLRVGAGADALPATDIEPRENGEPETGG